MSDEDLIKLAEIGAREELRIIYATFPNLKVNGATAEVVEPVVKKTKTKKKVAPAKVHWTQTAAGRKRMRAIGKRSWQKRR